MPPFPFQSLFGSCTRVVLTGVDARVLTVVGVVHDLREELR
jgi:hypothetical protein